MSYYQKGKALLIVEKDGDGLIARSISLSGVCTERASNWFDTAMELAVYCDWLPNQCQRMGPGDKMIFKTVFEQNYYKGDNYTTDDDEDLTFLSAVLLRWRHGADETRRVRKKYYRPKKKS